jgi:hypothetical protein
MSAWPKIAAVLIATLALSLASAAVALGQSTDPSVNDYQESAPGADGSLGGGGGGGPGGSGSNDSANHGGGDSHTTVPSTSPGTDPAGSPVAPASSSSGPNGGGGDSGANHVQGGGSSGSGSAGTATNTSPSSQDSSSGSGPGDLVEGVTSAFGGSDDTGMGIVFPALLVALVGASAVVLIRRRRES